MTARPQLPTGTVTMLFTDIEGSTRLLQELGRDEYVRALTIHRRLLREAFTRHGGVEVEMQGDSFFFAFTRASDAVRAAEAGQRALDEHEWELEPIRVRVGIHTGEPVVSDGLYAGLDVHRAARVMSAGHGGQVLVSDATARLLDSRIDLRDLGKHRLKDFAEPVWIYQLGAERFPPLKTISQTNLPRPASSFVGREREVGEVVALIRERSRLLTLTGPGGSGKTRLAIEAASELVTEFANGVFWVGVAALRDPALVEETIAKTLGAKGSLAEHIGNQELLLVIDNLEQVVDAAPELASLLEVCPSLQLLVTSRELLRVRAEVEYAIPPLAQSEAAALFCERSGRAVDATVLELCQRLDNLPLAVELAAGRTRALSPSQILERLTHRLDLLRGGRDANARQQTLRATIEWSYDLLTREEQRLFRRLAVFAGGCTLEAAEEVAEADLDTLQSLIEKSLLRFTNERYWMLETIRAYAVEMLELQHERDEIRNRHSQWVEALVEREEGIHISPDDVTLGRLGRELENIRAALQWMLESGRALDGLALVVGDLNWFWWAQGHLREALAWTNAFLEANGEAAGELRAKALTRIGFLAAEIGDLENAIQCSDAAVEMWRELGDEDWLIRALNGAASAWAAAGGHREAIGRYDEGIARAESSGLDHWSSMLCVNKAETLFEAGDLLGARALLGDAVGWAKSRGTGVHRMYALALLGSLSALERRPTAAHELREALRLATELSFMSEVHRCLSALAMVAAEKSKPEAAVLLLSYAEESERRFSEHPSRLSLRVRELALADASASLDPAEYADLEKRGQAMELNEAIDIASSLD